jgi:hypothetical protein
VQSADYFYVLSTDFYEILQNNEILQKKIFRSVTNELKNADRGTDMTKLTTGFRHFAKTPRNDIHAPSNTFTHIPSVTHDSRSNIHTRPAICLTSELQAIGQN